MMVNNLFVNMNDVVSDLVASSRFTLPARSSSMIDGEKTCMQALHKQLHAWSEDCWSRVGQMQP